MRLRPDNRRFSNEAERLGACRKCGCSLILLPRDKRQGYCFECFDVFLTIESSFDVA